MYVYTAWDVQFVWWLFKLVFQQNICFPFQTFPFQEWDILFNVDWIILHPRQLPHTDDLHSVNNPYGLQILLEFRNIWIVTSCTPLMLAAKEFFERVLTNPLTSKWLNVIQGEHILD